MPISADQFVELGLLDNATPQNIENFEAALTYLQQSPFCTDILLIRPLQT